MGSLKDNGGARKGAGRKPKIEEVKLIERLTPLEDSALEALKHGLADGDYRFVNLFFNYMYGKPKEKMDITTDGESINKQLTATDAREIIKALEDNF
jgi:hypothetical protein